MATEFSLREPSHATDIAARIAVYRHRLNQRLRHPQDGSLGIFPLAPIGLPPGQLSAGSVRDDLLQNPIIRQMSLHPVLVGLAAAAFFLAGPRRVAGIAARVFAYWKIAAPLLGR